MASKLEIIIIGDATFWRRNFALVPCGEANGGEVTIVATLGRTRKLGGDGDHNRRLRSRAAANARLSRWPGRAMYDISLRRKS